MTTDRNDDLTSPDEIDIDLSAGFADDLEPASDDIEINLDFGDFSEPVERDVDLNLDLDQFGDDSEPDEEPVQEPDDGLDRALEELRVELRSKPGEWYVVHTYSGMENRVKQNIDARVVTLNMEDYIYETLVPTEDAVEIRNGQRKNVTRTFMPGYVLVRMELTDESWAAVRHTPSVTGFVGHANQPVPLGLDEVERMLTPSVQAKVAAAGQAPRRRKKVEVVDYQVGDSVTVVDGPFAGVHATLTEINPHNQRVKAMVEILGRETPVDLTFPQIQKVV
ncbi:MAG: transcription termination/antitermination protein NusG [Acidobacteriota bacterium]|nr:transcription termination/antitermination protein NusG [Acidobacteriota bacterium]NLH70216.1 transcription termination/antitermination protein NusG [Brooklawnia sp.]